MSEITLNNQVKISQLGFGTFRIDDGKPVIDAVNLALELGYRHIDTAAIYDNETGVGQAIGDSGLARDSLFVTTKLWNRDHGYDATLRAFEMSLQKLQLDYVDLYLIHWPMDMSLVPETWKAFERLYHEGSVRAIGVSNFNLSHLTTLLPQCEVMPAINQVECHLALQQTALYDFCQQKQIRLEAWSPLMKGEFTCIETVQHLAQQYGKTPAQIVLRWHRQRGIIAIPKSVTPSRIQENLAIDDFQLSDSDMQLLAKLDESRRIGSDPDLYRKI